MHEAFWHDRWETQKIGFHLEEINPLLREFWSHLELGPDANILVPLCGKTLDLHFLTEKHAQIIGSELSAIAAKDFFDEAGLTPVISSHGKIQSYQAQNLAILQGDFFDIQPEQTATINGFYDRAALIAWPEQARLKYMEHLARLLPQGSRGLLITLDYPQQQLAGPPFATSSHWLEEYVTPFFRIQLLSSEDALSSNPKFVKNGVDYLYENVYLLERL
ncbi:thiopurine S-methyltransferase [Dongshaea marina]|uniref:thiopurine S-methyltransferase n=1 Tax=Dongshaea marina TaxID=2047966 RepID=UPI000D3E94C3|nr:thiopurine S-methyltransferase [Dongshaea marina]